MTTVHASAVIGNRNIHGNAVIRSETQSTSATVNNRSISTNASVNHNQQQEASASVHNNTCNTTVIAGGGGTTDHSRLRNLDYDNAGHTGFQRELIPDESITIDEEGHIHANGESYTAGTGITIDENNVISNNVSPLVPAQASVDNQLADKDFVNSSIATSTATFRGTYNVVTDLHLSTSATHQQVATALGNTISVADNNDYCFVEIPTDDLTPTETLQVDRYKYNGTSWSFEYTLNNSGYTSAQWKAINSGITSGKVTQYDDYATSKQDTLTAGSGISLQNGNINTQNIIWRTW